MFKGEQDNVILSFLVFSELGEGFTKWPRIQIDHQRAQRGAMGIQTQDLPLVRLTQPAKTVHDINIDIEERVTARIAVEGMFDETLRCRRIDAERLGSLLHLRLFV